MTIDAPRQSQMSELRRLWQEAFGDTQEFLDAFGRTAFHVTRCRVAVTAGVVAAALYWFDCLHMGKPVAYLYAVATAEAYRGRGICHELMEDTHGHLAGRGYQGVILVPGSRELIRFYEGMGYRVCSTIHEFTCIAADRDSESIPLRSIDKTEYALLRKEMLPEGGVVQESENLDFLQTQAQFYAGSGLLLTAKKEGDRLTGAELLGDEAKAPGIVRALGCKQGAFRTPGEGRDFAVYRSLTDHMSPPPTYFGLAFD